MKTPALVLSILVILNFLSCNSQGQQSLIVHKKAQELNDKALALFQKYSYSKDSLNKAIEILDNAILTDSIYKLAYTNEASIFCALGNYNSMLKILDKASKLDKKDPLLIIQQGHILEKMGNIDAAKKKYIQANILYDNLLISDPNSVKNEVDRAFLKLFLEDKEAGIREYEQIAKYSSDPYVINFKPFFYNFNRQEFINGYCITPSK